MRCAITTIALLFTTLSAMAQRPWQEYDEAQQERILSMRATHDEVREAYRNLEDLSYDECYRLLDIVTSPTRSKRVNSLYIDIYERLRSEDGGDAALDVRMLNHYARYMLNSWADDDGRFGLYSYAFSVGAYAANSGSKELLEGITQCVRRKASARCRREAELFISAADHVYNSVVLGQSISLDHTPIHTSEQLPRLVSHARYLSVESSYSSVATPELECDDVAYSMACEECITWADGFYTAIPATEELSDLGITLTHFQRAYGANIVIGDSHHSYYTLPHILYILPNGMLYAISTTEEWDMEYVVVGYIAYGSVTLCGTVAVEHGQLRGVKCNDEGLYLHLSTEQEQRCYMISAVER